MSGVSSSRAVTLVSENSESEAVTKGATSDAESPSEDRMEREVRFGSNVAGYKVRASRTWWSASTLIETLRTNDA